MGFPWAQTRSWTNGPGYAASGVNGVGWVDTYTPQLIEADGSTTNTLVVINNGTDASYFDLVDGVYQARFDSPSQLSYDSGTDIYTLVDGDGNHDHLHGLLDGSAGGAAWGVRQLHGRGDGTEHRGDVVHGQRQHRARCRGRRRAAATRTPNPSLYSYLGSTDPNAGLLSNVTLRTAGQRRDRGPSLQQVQYAYYDGTQNGGNLGDLMTATVENAGGTAISTSYYRYYTAGEANGYQHGLEYVVNPASYALMTAAWART